MQKVCLDSGWSFDTRIQTGFEFGVNKDNVVVDLPYCTDSSAFFCRYINKELIAGANKVVLCINGVQGWANILINNSIVATTGLLYDTIDITDFLDQDIDNLIAINIINAGGTSGVAGSVELLVGKSDIVVQPNGVFLSTVAIDDTCAKLNLNLCVDKLRQDNEWVAVKAFIEVFNHRNKRKARKLKKFKIRKSNIELNIPIKINKPILYNAQQSVDELDRVDDTVTLVDKKAYKYTVSASIMIDDVVVDTATTEFGVRTSGIRGRNFVFNGRVNRLNGAKIDNRLGVLGAISVPSIEQARLDAVKASGYNVVRTTGLPTQEFLDRCDASGIMCVVDVFGNLKDDDMLQHLKIQQQKNKVIRDCISSVRNHPCVIAYCIADCLGATYARGDGLKWAKSTIDCIRQLDNTRLITAVVTELIPTKKEVGLYVDEQNKKRIAHSREPLAELAEVARERDLFGHCTKEFIELLDFVCYKNLSHRYEKDCKQNPKRLILPVDTDSKNLEAAMTLAEDCLNCIGDIAGEYCFDYYGKSTHINEYRQILTGVRQKACIVAYDSDSVGNVDKAQESWNFPKEVGKPIKVEVFTSGDVVALCDDNNSTISRRLAGRLNGRKASFDVVYKPGDIHAVAYYKGGEHAKATLSGASIARSTKMSVDKKIISVSKKRDLAIIDMTILDKQGRVVTYANREVIINVSEEIKVVAIGNSSTPKVHTFARRHDEVVIPVVDGRARFAVVGLKEGKAQISAFCEGLLKSKLSMTVKA